MPRKFYQKEKGERVEASLEITVRTCKAGGMLKGKSAGRETRD